MPAGLFGPQPAEIQFGTKYNNNALVDFSQTLFDKAKIAAIKANKPYLELTQLQKEQNQEQLIYNASLAYFQVLIYKEQLKNLKVNQIQYEQLIQILTTQKRLGTILQKDLDRVKVSLNTTNYQITDGKAKEELALNNLKNSIGLSLDSSLVITDDFNYSVFATDITGGSFKAEQLVLSEIYTKQIELEEINLKTKKAAFLPVITAIGRLGSQSLNNNFSEAFSSWNGYSYIGASFSLPIFNGLKRKSLISEQKLNLNNNIKNFNISKETLKLNYENTYTASFTAYNSFKSNKENMDLAKNIADLTYYQYEKGVASLTDFLNDDTAYKNAQSIYISSLYNLMINQVNYQNAQGNIVNYVSQFK